jgi:leucyl aminopeptidase (aminopeptidase T)
MKELLMYKSAARLVDECLCVRKGEKVVIVTDLNKVSIATVLASVLYERDVDLSICVMKPRSRHSEDPPAPIAAAMAEADAVIMPATYSLTHSQARRTANERGARVLSLPMYTEEVMTSSALDVDFQQLRSVVWKAADLLDAAESARITSASGTDLRMSLAGKRKRFNDCIADKPGVWAAPPGLEATIAPVEDSTNGTVVLDGVLIPGGVVEGEVRIEFKDGKIWSIAGNKQADEFSRLLVSYNDPNVYYAVELGIGLNPNSQLGRNMIESESAYGTVHIGLGEGKTFGSTISASAHLDIVMATPELELDGKKVVSARKLFLES